MSVDPAYPQVRVTPENQPMLEAWRARGEILLQRCGACGTFIFYPRAICPQCWCEDLAWVRADGRGTVVSFSLVHRGLPDVFMQEVPIVLAEIALAEGVRMIARILHPDPGCVATGDTVVPLDPQDAGCYPLPTFRPEPRR